MKSVTCAVTLLILSVTVQATEMASANYGISWDVADGGGGLLTSPGYVLTDSVGQPATGFSSSANYFLQAGFQAPPDFDDDVVKDFMDNCSVDHNPNQRDTNNDGFGNVCDADVSNDLIVNFLDLLAMRLAFFSTPASPSWNPDADFNDDGIINFLDLLLVRAQFFGPPGPSGIAP